MERPQQKSVVLILARELAMNIATPMFLVERSGRLVFFNEAAEAVLGRSFAQVGEIEPEEWGTIWAPEDLDGAPIRLDDLPLAATLIDRTPSHSCFRITGLDGERRTISVTAIPLLSHVDELAGAVGIFWEDPSVNGDGRP